MNHSNANQPSVDVLEAIFLQTIKIDSPEDRQAFVQQACGADSDLRAKVLQMVQAHQGEDAFFDGEKQFAESIFPHSNLPDSFGEFKVVREIGRGGMGIVYEAQQESLNRRVALKVLSVGLEFSSKSILRFQREAEAAARLRHTNIVPIYTTGVQNQIPYYAMELVRGPSLDLVIQQLRDRPSRRRESTEDGTTGNPSQDGNQQGADMETVVAAQGETQTGSSSLGSGADYFDNVARMMAEVAEALEHAHQAGVVHRDIKPSNLLLGVDGHLQISDFGLARIIESPGVTVTGELMGSPRYMSPEQISSDHGQVDHRTDIYSLGLTLYELITLQPALDSEQRDRVLAQVLSKQPTAPRKINPRIPLDLETICLKAIEKSPTARYQKASELADDLRRFVDRRAIAAKRIGWGGYAIRWCRRNRALAAVTTLLFLAVAVGALLVTAHGVKQRRQWTIARQEIEKALENDPWRARLLVNSAWQQFPNRRDEIRPLLESIGREMKIVSAPAGAQIFVRPKSATSGTWLPLGVTPLRTHLPIQDFHVRATIDEQGELIAAKSTGYEPVDTWHLTLPTRPDMVVVNRSVTDTQPDACRITWLLGRRLPIAMPTFQIDQHEVTNAQYKEFVDAGENGGYYDERYWLETLGPNWNDVVKTFKDRRNEHRGPALWENGTFPEGMANHPVVGVSWYEAMAYSKWAGKQLPTLFHWLRGADYNGWARAYDSHQRYNIGNQWLTHRSVEDGWRSVNHFGVSDMHGNVKEWCLNEEHDGTYYAMGGSWMDEDGSGYDPVSFKPTERRPDTGFRCAIYQPNPEWALAMPVQWREIPTEPRPIEEYISLFRFDRDKPLNSTGPEAVTFHGVEGQQFQFDAGYGEDQRVTCYVIFPDRTKFAPPYQVMVGTSPIFLDENGNPTTNTGRWVNYSPMMNAGRALVLPTFWGLSHDRSPENFNPRYPSEQSSEVYVDAVSKMAKDLIRTVDFLHREYPRIAGEGLLDMDKLIFVSCWCLQSECMLVADKLVTGENRFAATFFCIGGIQNLAQPTAVDQLTYLPHLDTPSVIINKEGLLACPREFSQNGMMKLLPISPKLKKLYSVPGWEWGSPVGHIQREVNSWLNQLESLGKAKTYRK